MKKKFISLLLIMGGCVIPFSEVRAQTTYSEWCERAGTAIEGDSRSKAEEGEIRREVLHTAMSEILWADFQGP